MPISPAASRSFDGRDHRLAEDRLAVEHLDGEHHQQRAADDQRAPSAARWTPPSSMRGLGQRRGEFQVVAAPDVLGDVLEDDAERDRGHDPAGLGLDLDRRPHADPLDDGALQRAEDAAPAGSSASSSRRDRRDQRQADQGAEHQRLALAEIQRLGGGEGQLVAEGDDARRSCRRAMPLTTSWSRIHGHRLRLGGDRAQSRFRVRPAQWRQLTAERSLRLESSRALSPSTSSGCAGTHAAALDLAEHRNVAR